MRLPGYHVINMLLGCYINEEILAIIVSATVRDYTLQQGNHTIGILPVKQNI